MLRKLFILFFMFVCFQTSVFAEILSHKIYVVSDQNISSVNIKKNDVYTFQTIERCKISNEEYIENGASVKIAVKKIIPAKRGKRDEYLKIQVLSYTNPLEGNEIINVEKKVVTGTLRLSEEKDLDDIRNKAGISVVGHILKVPALTQVVAVSKGLINPNEDESRIVSAGKNLYESTPFTYVEKGNALNIEPDSILVIKVKEYNGEIE